MSYYFRTILAYCYFKCNLYLTLVINQSYNFSINVINIKYLNDSIAYLKLPCLSHTFNISISRNDIIYHEFLVVSSTTTRNADTRRVKNKYAHMNKRNVRIFMNELKYLHLFPYNHIDQESKPKMCDIPLYYFYFILPVVAEGSYTDEVIICIKCCKRWLGKRLRSSLSVLTSNKIHLILRISNFAKWCIIQKRL